MNKFTLSVSVYTRYTDNFTLAYLQRKIIDGRHFFGADNFEILYIEYYFAGLRRSFLYLKFNRTPDHFCSHLVFGGSRNVYHINKFPSPYDGATVCNVLNFL